MRWGLFAAALLFGLCLAVGTATFSHGWTAIVSNVPIDEGTAFLGDVKALLNSTIQWWRATENREHLVQVVFLTAIFSSTIYGLGAAISLFFELKSVQKNPAEFFERLAENVRNNSSSEAMRAPYKPQERKLRSASETRRHELLDRWAQQLREYYQAMYDDVLNSKSYLSQKIWRLLTWGALVPTLGLACLIVFYESFFAGPLPLFVEGHAQSTVIPISMRLAFVIDQVARGLFFDIIETFGWHFSIAELNRSALSFTTAIATYRIALSIFIPFSFVFALDASKMKPEELANLDIDQLVHRKVDPVRKKFEERINESKE